MAAKYDKKLGKYAIIDLENQIVQEYINADSETEAIVKYYNAHKRTIIDGSK